VRHTDGATNFLPAAGRRRQASAYATRAVSVVACRSRHAPYQPRVMPRCPPRLHVCRAARPPQPGAAVFATPRCRTAADAIRPSCGKQQRSAAAGTAGAGNAARAAVATACASAAHTRQHTAVQAKTCTQRRQRRRRQQKSGRYGVDNRQNAVPYSQRSIWSDAEAGRRHHAAPDAPTMSQDGDVHVQRA